MTNGTSPCEPERQEKLLDCLRCGLLSDVPGTLLRDPLPGTRPHVKLVAHLPRLWQVFLSSTLYKVCACAERSGACQAE